MAVIDAELKRRDQANNLVGWLLNNDGTDPVNDAAAIVKLEAIRVLLATGVLVGGPLTNAELRASAPSVKDDYQTGEVLADQAGAGAVLTFTFAAARNLVLIQPVGTGTQEARADPFGGVPAVALGIRCADGTPTYIPVTTSSVKIFAPTGMAVTVIGFSRT